MGRRPLPGRGRRHHHRRTAERDRLVERSRWRATGSTRGRRRPAAAGGRRRRSGHGPVLRRGTGVEAIRRRGREHGEAKVAKTQLAVETEQVEHPAALLGVEAAHGGPALVTEQARPRPPRRPRGRCVAARRAARVVKHRRSASMPSSGAAVALVRVDEVRRGSRPAPSRGCPRRGSPCRPRRSSRPLSRHAQRTPGDHDRSRRAAPKRPGDGATGCAIHHGRAAPQLVRSPARAGVATCAAARSRGSPASSSPRTRRSRVRAPFGCRRSGRAPRPSPPPRSPGRSRCRARR